MQRYEKKMSCGVVVMGIKKLYRLDNIYLSFALRGKNKAKWHNDR
jgi:hypothetical protein